MARILGLFRLIRPCSTPLLVVAHSRAHAASVLIGLGAIYHSDTYPRLSNGTAPQSNLCRQLRAQLVDTAPPGFAEELRCHAQMRMSAEMQGIAEARAQAAVPSLMGAFSSMRVFKEAAAARVFE